RAEGQGNLRLRRHGGTAVGEARRIHAGVKRRRRAGIRKTSRAAEMPSMTTALEQRAASRVAPIGLLFLVTASVGWGLNWPAMKFVFSEWPPLSARGWAGVIAAAALALYAVATGVSLKVPADQWPTAHHLGDPQHRAVGRGDELCAALAASERGRRDCLHYAGVDGAARLAAAWRAFDAASRHSACHGVCRPRLVVRRRRHV